MEEKLTLQNEPLLYLARRRFTFGDVVYRIEPAETVYFRSVCRVCEGKQQITVNGVTFRCPMCQQEEKTFSVQNYLVRRYRMCGISDEVCSNEWKPSKVHYVSVMFYRKIGAGSVGIYNERGGRFECNPELLRLNVEKSDVEKHRGLNYVIYDDYALAVKVAEGLTAKELERLAAYNKEKGTSHVAVFQKTHDPKSK